MLKKIAVIFQSSLISALINLIIIVITSRYLGPTGRGLLSLVLANTAITQIFSAIIGSASLVYLIPRHPIGNLFVLSYLWAFICCTTIPFLLSLINIIDLGLIYPVMIISFFQTIIENNNQVLLGVNKIGSYNASRLVQPLSLILMLFLLIQVGILCTENFMYSLYCSSFVTLATSWVLLAKNVNNFNISNPKSTIKGFLKLGLLNQLNYLMQLGNYRYSYFLLNSFSGLSSLGIFSLGVSLAEAVWLFRTSITTIHYLDVSQQTDLTMAKRNNGKLVTIALFGTLAILGAALAIPLKIYLYVFGNEFSQIKEVIWLLSPGVAALAVGSIISHYFSGIGKIHLNTYSSGAGFIIILIAGGLLIPTYGIRGAAIANSLSYITTSVVIFLQYKRHLKRIS